MTEENEMVERLYVALETEADLRRALQARAANRAATNLGPGDAFGGPPMARLVAFVRGPETRLPSDIARRLLREPSFARDFRALVSRIGSANLPAVAAAATGRPSERRGDGVLIRLVPSRSTAGQTYVVVEWDDAGSEKAGSGEADLGVGVSGDAEAGGVSALILLRAGEEPLKLPLPPAIGGRVQVLVEDRSEIALALDDPTTELVLA